MAKISIIIPVYNAESYLERCLSSLLKQTFQDFQLILVNDGSTDSSKKICEKYEKEDLRIHVLNKKNGGAASARNLGLDWFYENESSEWLCFVDSDDFVHERYLEILLGMAQKNNSSISMCSYKTVYEDSLETELPEYQDKLVDMENLWCERQINCTIPVVKLFKSKLFTNIRFPEGIIHEDEFTLYKVLFQCERIVFADVPLYGYYQTVKSVMRGDWTPRHMTEPQGLFAQLEFFIHNNYKKASSYTAKIYLRSLYRNIMAAREQETKYQREIDILHNKLKTDLKKYKRMAGITINNSEWLFYEAYPGMTIPYRVYKRCLRMIRRKEKNV